MRKTLTFLSLLFISSTAMSAGIATVSARNGDDSGRVANSKNTIKIELRDQLSEERGAAPLYSLKVAYLDSKQEVKNIFIINLKLDEALMLKGQISDSKNSIEFDRCDANFLCDMKSVRITQTP